MHTDRNRLADRDIAVMTPGAKAGPIRVVLADDHRLVRSGIKALLSRMEGVEVIAEAGDGLELVRLVETLRPDLVVTDIDMPGIDGLEALSAIHQHLPDIRLLVLSMHHAADFVRRAVSHGAHGYLLKDASCDELEQAVRSVMGTGKYFGPAVAQLLLQPAVPAAAEELTSRQLEVLKLMAQGKAAKQIALQLALSPKTVDVHRSRIMDRLGLHNLASLTLYALRHGLVKL